MADGIVSGRLKRCPRCKLELPIEAFHNPKSPVYCKPCRGEYRRQGRPSQAERLAEIYPEEGKKRCPACREVKPITEYSERKGRKAKSKCKPCSRLDWRLQRLKKDPSYKPMSSPDDRKNRIAEKVKRRWDITDTHRKCSGCGERKELSKFRAKNSAKCRDCKNAYNLAQKRKDPERHKKYLAHRYATAKDRFAEKRRLYKTANLEKVKMWARMGTQRRRALKLATLNTLTESEWEAIKWIYDHKCLKCLEVKDDLTMDHVIPLSKGGTHTMDNIQPLCLSCNCSKHTKATDYRPRFMAMYFQQVGNNDAG